MDPQLCACAMTSPGGIENSLAEENFRKILKFSQFYLENLLDKKSNDIKHSHRVLLEFFGPGA